MNIVDKIKHNPVGLVTAGLCALCARERVGRAREMGREQVSNLVQGA